MFIYIIMRMLENVIKDFSYLIDLQSRELNQIDCDCIPKKTMVALYDKNYENF